ncbi:AraC family transcriptional regulator [Massilia sp. DJPM01]|uniref:GlxA family transcriptional regulator n=1 Tax=Massilia sp. DJPM01 TaxID=3024404 RepID=UPI002803B011|nr:AraC family transcriptional regulator [Massilia sp. DJPM01]
MPGSTTRRIVFLAYEDMNLLDLAGPLQAFATANRLGQAAGATLPYDTVVASVGGGSVMSSAGLAVDTRALATLDGTDIDTLIVAGGCKGEEFTVCPDLVDWIARHAAGARRVCSVCSGAFVLAATGQLDGRRVATHWAWAERLQQRHPQVRVDADALFIQDGALWTSAGVTAGIDMSLALIEADHGHQIAIQTARQLVMFIKRAGGQSQFSVPLATQARDDGNFASLHSWIAGHIDQDLGVARLAQMATCRCAPSCASTPPRWAARRPRPSRRSAWKRPAGRWNRAPCP